VKSLAKELGPKCIRVNGVAPGPIWTPLQVSGGATMEKLEKFGGRTPFSRPAELASIYMQLAAADASYATVQVCGSSGGSGSLERLTPCATQAILRELNSSLGCLSRRSS
jgi:NAD(P)-dependent dehydrogenase (short-subunit alcohol dehydrogenase family)